MLEYPSADDYEGKKRLLRCKRLSCSRLIKRISARAFKDIVPDISAIGTHSFRSGGATAAANASVPDRHFYASLSRG